jgi:BirA family transcriptional regulator, biotin operon repressor / biotin---[acetyl-CoA-carboxylase] ligase
MIHRVPVTTSTNDDLRALALAGAPHGTAVLADVQTGGRGRLGRRWDSPPGANVLLSVLVRLPIPPSRLALVTLGAAVATATACGPAYRIKWPNDVLAPDGRKVAGILAEAEWANGLPEFVIVGVGVNVGAAPPLPTATRLDDDGTVHDRDTVAADVLRGILVWAETLVDDVRPVVDAWRARSATLGARVRVNDVEGVALDIGDDGALVVRTDDGTVQRVLAGDVAMVG